MNESPEFRQWAILELLGHVKVAGLVTEEEHFGVKLGRIDIPRENGEFTTQLFSGSSIYRLTPTTEAIARSVAARNQPTPAHRWELPALPAPERQEDPHEREASDRLIQAARHIANRGSTDNDTYICSADAGTELRAALGALDSLHEQRDREQQEAGDDAELWEDVPYERVVRQSG